jgi:hypothetical protein
MGNANRTDLPVEDAALADLVFVCLGVIGW